nr:hypothetical protein [Inquilinus sp. Marseille-Q2685]
MTKPLRGVSSCSRASAALASALPASAATRYQPAAARGSGAPTAPVSYSRPMLKAPRGLPLALAWRNHFSASAGSRVTPAPLR